MKLRVKRQYNAFYTETGQYIDLQIRAVQFFFDARMKICFDDIVEVIVFVFKEFAKSPRIILLHIKKQRRVHRPEHLRYQVHGQENFMNGIFGPAPVAITNQLVLVNFLANHFIYQLVFIGKILVNGFFAHPHAIGNIIHAYAPEPVLHEQNMCLLPDSGAIVYFCHNRVQNYGNFLRYESFHHKYLPFITINSLTPVSRTLLKAGGIGSIGLTLLKKDHMVKSFQYTKLLQYFFQGLLILAPVAITFYAFYWVVSGIDGLIPIFTFTDDKGVVHVQNYGVGFVAIILLIIVIGYFSSFFITSRIVSFTDKVMQKMPGIKHIYSTTRDFFEAFTGDKKKFTHNVLANVDDNDVWRVGFITAEDMGEYGLKDYVAVYIPMAYSVAGNVYIIPKSRIRDITHISSAQTMKFAVSGGVTHIDENDKKDEIAS